MQCHLLMKGAGSHHSPWLELTAAGLVHYTLIITARAAISIINTSNTRYLLAIISEYVKCIKISCLENSNFVIFIPHVLSDCIESASALMLNFFAQNLFISY